MKRQKTGNVWTCHPNFKARYMVFTAFTDSKIFKSAAQSQKLKKLRSPIQRIFFDSFGLGKALSVGRGF